MNALPSPAPETTAYKLREQWWACRWIPVKADEPSAGPAGEWKRLKLLPKALLSLLLNQIKSNPRTAEDWCVPRPSETREERFFSKRRLAEALDCSRRTIQRCADLLVRLGLLERCKRDWGANRWQVNSKGLTSFLRWNAALSAQVREADIAQRMGRDVETLPVVEAPVVEPLAGSRAERRLDASSAPWEPRPQVGRLWGVFDLPQLVEWGLGRAEWALARGEMPDWAKKAEQSASAPARHFARLVIAWAAIVHGDCARTELLSFASGYARRLSVAWRGAGRAAPEEFLPLIASVEWARLAQVLDRKVVQGGRACRVTPRAADVLAPGTWAENLRRALDARREALAEAAAVVEAPVVEAPVVEAPVVEGERQERRAAELLQIYAARVTSGELAPEVAVELARPVRGGQLVEAARAALGEAVEAARRRRRGPEPG